MGSFGLSHSLTCCSPESVCCSRQCVHWPLELWLKRVVAQYCGEVYTDSKIHARRLCGLYSSEGVSCDWGRANARKLLLNELCHSCSQSRVMHTDDDPDPIATNVINTINNMLV